MQPQNSTPSATLLLPPLGQHQGSISIWHTHKKEGAFCYICGGNGGGRCRAGLVGWSAVGWPFLGSLKAGLFQVPFTSICVNAPNDDDMARVQIIVELVSCRPQKKKKKKKMKLFYWGDNLYGGISSLCGPMIPFWPHWFDE